LANDTLRKQHLRLVLPVLLTVLIFSVVTVALLYKAVTTQNAAVVQSSQHFAASFFEVRERRLQSVLLDHARWNDDAVENLLIKFSRSWAEYNLGRYLHDVHAVSLTLVIGGKDEVIYAASDGATIEGFDLQRLGAGFARVLEEARSRARSGGEPLVTSLVVDGKSVELVAAGLLPPSPVPSPDPDAVLVVTRRLDSAGLVALADDYGLHNLRLYLPDQTVSAPATLKLTDLDGHTVGIASWQTKLPGGRLLRVTLPAVAAANLVIVVLIGVFLIRARRLFLRVEAASTRIAAQNVALAESELHLRTIYDTVPDGLVTIDSAGAILTANPAAQRVFGRREDQLKGLPLSRLFDGFPAEILAPEFARRSDEIGTSCELTGLRGDSAHFAADLAISGASSSEPRFRVALVRDISERKRIETVLNLLSIDILVVDGEGRLLMANGSGSRRLSSRDGLTSADGVVRPIVGEATRLHEAIRAAADGKAPGSTTLNLPRPGGHWPLSVLVTSLGTAHSLWDRAAVVLFVSDPEHRVSVSVASLVDLYGLTPAEARLAGELVKGKDLQQIAAECALSVNTLRNQLKQVFRKTGTSRQPELVSLVLSSASPIAGSQAPAESPSDAAAQ
jgi:PAS domain S-box-containing protein